MLPWFELSHLAEVPPDVAAVPQVSVVHNQEVFPFSFGVLLEYIEVLAVAGAAKSWFQDIRSALCFF